MAIFYTCPHCNKQYSVAEQYAGQTGPCAACGKPITIPQAGMPQGMPGGYAYAPTKPAGGGGGTAVAIIAVLVVALLVCPGILIALLLPAVQAARTAARRAQSSNNLKQIALAMHNYHDVHGTFPPAVVTDADGKPLYSGRVLLLPYIEQVQLYNAFNKDEPWNSPSNQALSQQMIKVFQDPASTSAIPGQTDYVFVTGTGTMFEGDKATKMMEVTDGTSNTMMIVEMKGSGINWAEPRDLDLSNPTLLPPGNYPMGNNTAFADGSVRFMSNSTPPPTVRAAATKSGGEVVPLP